MKSFFTRKHDSQPRPSKLSSTRDSYKFWVPQSRNDADDDRTKFVADRVYQTLPADAPKAIDKNVLRSSRRQLHPVDEYSRLPPPAAQSHRGLDRTGEPSSYPAPAQYGQISLANTYPRSTQRPYYAGTENAMPSGPTSPVPRPEPPRAASRAASHSMVPTVDQQRGYSTDYAPKLTDKTTSRVKPKESTFLRSRSRPVEESQPRTTNLEDDTKQEKDRGWLRIGRDRSRPPDRERRERDREKGQDSDRERERGRDSEERMRRENEHWGQRVKSAGEREERRRGESERERLRQEKDLTEREIQDDRRRKEREEQTLKAKEQEHERRQREREELARKQREAEQEERRRRDRERDEVERKQREHELEVEKRRREREENERKKAYEQEQERRRREKEDLEQERRKKEREAHERKLREEYEQRRRESEETERRQKEREQEERRREREEVERKRKEQEQEQERRRLEEYERQRKEQELAKEKERERELRRREREEYERKQKEFEELQQRKRREKEDQERRQKELLLEEERRTREREERERAQKELAEEAERRKREREEYERRQKAIAEEQERQRLEKEREEYERKQRELAEERERQRLEKEREEYERKLRELLEERERQRLEKERQEYERKLAEERERQRLEKEYERKQKELAEEQEARRLEKEKQERECIQKELAEEQERRNLEKDHERKQNELEEQDRRRAEKEKERHDHEHKQKELVEEQERRRREEYERRQREMVEEQERRRREEYERRQKEMVEEQDRRRRERDEHERRQREFFEEQERRRRDKEEQDRKEKELAEEQERRQKEKEEHERRQQELADEQDRQRREKEEHEHKQKEAFEEQERRRREKEAAERKQKELAEEQEKRRREKEEADRKQRELAEEQERRQKEKDEYERKQRELAEEQERRRREKEEYERKQRELSEERERRRLEKEAYQRRQKEIAEEQERQRREKEEQDLRQKELEQEQDRRRREYERKRREREEHEQKQRELEEAAEQRRKEREEIDRRQKEKEAELERRRRELEEQERERRERQREDLERKRKLKEEQDRKQKEWELEQHRREQEAQEARQREIEIERRRLEAEQIKRKEQEQEQERQRQLALELELSAQRQLKEENEKRAREELERQHQFQEAEGQRLKELDRQRKEGEEQDRRRKTQEQQLEHERKQREMQQEWECRRRESLLQRDHGHLGEVDMRREEVKNQVAVADKQTNGPENRLLQDDPFERQKQREMVMERIKSREQEQERERQLQIQRDQERQYQRRQDDHGLQRQPQPHASHRDRHQPPYLQENEREPQRLQTNSRPEELGRDHQVYLDPVQDQQQRLNQREAMERDAKERQRNLDIEQEDRRRQFELQNQKLLEERRQQDEEHRRQLEAQEKERRHLEEEQRRKAELELRRHAEEQERLAHLARQREEQQRQAEERERQRQDELQRKRRVDWEQEQERLKRIELERREKAIEMERLRKDKESEMRRRKRRELQAELDRIRREKDRKEKEMIERNQRQKVEKDQEARRLVEERIGHHPDLGDSHGQRDQDQRRSSDSTLFNEQDPVPHRGNHQPREPAATVTGEPSHHKGAPASKSIPVALQADVAVPLIFVHSASNANLRFGMPGSSGPEKPQFNDNDNAKLYRFTLGDQHPMSPAPEQPITNASQPTRPDMHSTVNQQTADVNAPSRHIYTSFLQGSRNPSSSDQTPSSKTNANVVRTSPAHKSSMQPLIQPHNPVPSSHRLSQNSLNQHFLYNTDLATPGQAVNSSSQGATAGNHVVGSNVPNVKSSPKTRDAVDSLGHGAGPPNTIRSSVRNSIFDNFMGSTSRPANGSRESLDYMKQRSSAAIPPTPQIQVAPLKSSPRPVPDHIPPTLTTTSAQNPSLVLPEHTKPAMLGSNERHSSQFQQSDRYTPPVTERATFTQQPASLPTQTERPGSQDGKRDLGEQRRHFPRAILESSRMATVPLPGEKSNELSAWDRRRQSAQVQIGFDIQSPHLYQVPAHTSVSHQVPVMKTEPSFQPPPRSASVDQGIRQTLSKHVSSAILNANVSAPNADFQGPPAAVDPSTGALHGGQSSQGPDNKLEVLRPTENAAPHIGLTISRPATAQGYRVVNHSSTSISGPTHEQKYMDPSTQTLLAGEGIPPSLAPFNPVTTMNMHTDGRYRQADGRSMTTPLVRSQPLPAQQRFESRPNPMMGGNSSKESLSRQPAAISVQNAPSKADYLLSAILGRPQPIADGHVRYPDNNGQYPLNSTLPIKQPPGVTISDSANNEPNSSTPPSDRRYPAFSSGAISVEVQGSVDPVQTNSRKGSNPVYNPLPPVGNGVPPTQSEDPVVSNRLAEQRAFHPHSTRPAPLELPPVEPRHLFSEGPSDQARYMKGIGTIDAPSVYAEQPPPPVQVHASVRPPTVALPALNLRQSDVAKRLDRAPTREDIPRPSIVPTLRDRTVDARQSSTTTLAQVSTRPPLIELPPLVSDSERNSQQEIEDKLVKLSKASNFRFPPSSGPLGSVRPAILLLPSKGDEHERMSKYMASQYRNDPPPTSAPPTVQRHPILPHFNQPLVQNQDVQSRAAVLPRNADSVHVPGHKHSSSLPTTIPAPGPNAEPSRVTTRTTSSSQQRSVTVPILVPSSSRHVPIPLPNRSYETLHPKAGEADETILLTPSSLAAPTMLPSISQQFSRPVPIQESPPAPIENSLRDKIERQPSNRPSAPALEPQPSRRESGRSRVIDDREPAPRSKPARRAPRSPRKASVDVNKPRTVPILQSPEDPRKRKVFNPFHYLGSGTRKRTMSMASLEARDGTAASTVVGSPSTSICSTAPFQLPPIQDPLVAAEEWRNKEEAKYQESTKNRRPRPGVVIPLAEDSDEDNKPSRKPARRFGQRRRTSNRPPPSQDHGAR